MAVATKLILALLLFHLATTAYSKGKGGGQPKPAGQPAGQPAKPGKPGKPGKAAKPDKAPTGGKKWCVAKQGTSPQALQANIDYVCGKGVDCKPIGEGGACSSNDLAGKASYLMNAYYQANGGKEFNCDFSGSGQLVVVNPSKGTCTFNA